MSLRPVLFTCLLVALISLLLYRSAVTAAPSESSLNVPVKGPGWQKITIDNGPGIGQTLSLAINPLSKNPYISYYDGINGDLKLAFPVSSGGDCGPGNTWSCNSLHYTNSETFGSYSLINFNSAGAWEISYTRTSPSTSVSFDGTPATGNTQFFTGVEGTKYIAYWGTSFQYSLS